MILGDEPTYAYVPPVYYYQGRVREGHEGRGAADSYREYLEFRGNSTEDPYLPEIRKRIGRVSRAQASHDLKAPHGPVMLQVPISL